MPKHECFISDLVLKEIENAPESKRDKLRKIVTGYKLQALKLTKEANILAEEYLKQEIIPKRYSTDALHIAIAVINNMDAIISWNMQHIVRLKTIKCSK